MSVYKTSDFFNYFQSISCVMYTKELFFDYVNQLYLKNENEKFLNVKYTIYIV